MKKMEILLVEDNLEYLEVAKKFFDSVEDVNVDYAMDRTTALQKLESKKYDGVITDRSMPAFWGAFLQKDVVSKEDEMWATFYDQLQGDIVAYSAFFLKDIPVVIHSFHSGASTFSCFYQKININNVEELAEIINKYSATSLEEFIENSLNPLFLNLMYEKNRTGAENVRGGGSIQIEGRYAIKSDIESWEYSFISLKEQIQP